MLRCFASLFTLLLLSGCSFIAPMPTNNLQDIAHVETESTIDPPVSDRLDEVFIDETRLICVNDEFLTDDHDSTSDVETDDHDPVNDIKSNADDCFSTIVAQYNEPFIASSILTAKTSDGRWIIALNSPTDDAVFVQFDNSTAVAKTVAQNAQISCLEPWKDGVRLGLIVRNSDKSIFSQEVQEFNASLDASKKAWHVSARGFQPDAGTRCGFVAENEILVTGFRSRHKKAPHHGLFRVRNRDLKFYENTQAHTPVFVALNKKEIADEILLKEVIHDENDKASLTYSVYTFGKDKGSKKKGTIVHVKSADFIVPYASDWLSISKSGCCEYAGKQCCLGTGDELSEVSYLGNTDSPWMMWNTRHNAWIVHPTEGGEINAIPVAPNRRVVYLDDEFWAVYELDSRIPDVGKDLKIVRIDHECFRSGVIEQSSPYALFCPASS